jgi:HSP20 family protein
MSNLTRWEPVREMMTLREAMDRLFDDAFTRPLSTGGISLLPAIDMYETSEEVIAKVALPGFSPDDVQITITGETLTLRGEYKAQPENKEVTYHLREQRFGMFERTLALPVDVKTDKANAHFENGILTITLPKADEVKPRTISIKAK